MNVEDLKKVIELNRLAKEWLRDFKSHKLGEQSQKLDKQKKEMLTLLNKTNQIIERNGGATIDTGNWEKVIQQITEKAATSSLFSFCLDGGVDPLTNGAEVEASDLSLAVELKQLVSSCIGSFSDQINDNRIKNQLEALYDQSLRVIKAPKSNSDSGLVLDFYATDSKRCRKMAKKMESIADTFNGILQIEFIQVANTDTRLNGLCIKNLPAMDFKRNGKRIALHEGPLSISMTEKKINMLLAGGSLSDSSSVDSIKDLKSLNQKELYAMGEFLLFYFEAAWCGTCKKTTPVVEKFGTSRSKVRFERIQVDGSHQHHRAFEVTHVPCIVFIRDGEIVGKHYGYLNPSAMEEKMDHFATSNKREVGDSDTGDASILPYARKIVDPK